MILNELEHARHQLAQLQAENQRLKQQLGRQNQPRSHSFAASHDLDNLQNYRMAADHAFSIAQMGFWVVQVQSGQAFCNPQLYQLHGRNPAQVVSTLGQLMQWVPEPYRQQLAATYAAALEAGQGFTFDYLADQKQLRLHADLGFAPNGQLTQVFGIVQDVSRLQSQQQQLDLINLRYNNLLESMSSAFYLVDPNWRFLFVNRHFEEVVEMQRADLLGHGLWEKFPHLVGTGFFFMIQQVAQTQQPGRTETYYEPNQQWYDVHAAPSQEGVLVFFTNITERKRLELQLTRLNENKDLFFSILAHDLRSPLASILSFTEIAAQNSQASAADCNQAMTYLNANLRQVYKLLENLLVWGKLQLNQIEFSPRLFNLSALVRNTAQLFDLIAQQKNIGIVLDVPTHLEAYADQEMVSTIVRNLLSNAVKFSYSGSKVQLVATASKHQVVLQVIDQGMGMSPQQAAQIFDLPNNAQSTGTGGESGTGLGLKISAELASRNGSQLQVSSSPGKGSIFSLVLPAQAPLV